MLGLDTMTKDNQEHRKWLQNRIFV